MNRAPTPVLLAILFTAACLPTSDAPLLERGQDMAQTTDMPPDMMVEPRSPCIPEEDALREPRSINDAMALIEVLPKPLTIPCFVESLARPLRIHATRGQISAQPAVGRRSPRVFIFFEPLVLSIALDGEGSFLLEFGELDGVGNSIKGEIEFPVMGSLPRNKPYTHVMYDDTITVCAFCHANERVAFEVDGAPVHISVALRPTDRERIMIDELWMEHMTCDSGLEPRRCAILKAIFKNDDDVFEGYFPDDLPTFY